MERAHSTPKYSCVNAVLSPCLHTSLKNFRKSFCSRTFKVTFCYIFLLTTLLTSFYEKSLISYLFADGNNTKKLFLVFYCSRTDLHFYFHNKINLWEDTSNVRYYLLNYNCCELLIFGLIKLAIVYFITC